METIYIHSKYSGKVRVSSVSSLFWWNDFRYNMLHTSRSPTHYMPQLYSNNTQTHIENDLMRDECLPLC